MVRKKIKNELNFVLEIFDKIGNLCFQFAQTTVLIDDLEVEIQDIYILSPASYDVSILIDEFCFLDTMLTISEPNPVTLTLGPDLIVNPNDSISISAETNLLFEDIEFIRWENSQGVLDVDALQFISSYESNDFVSVYIQDKNGCEGFDTLLISVNSPNIILPQVLLPNVLSLNNPNGNNLFDLSIIGGLEQVEYFRIYDRWGNLVYDVDQVDAQDPELIWDGRFNGQFVSSGVYLYMASIVRDGQVEKLVGDITVLH